MKASRPTQPDDWETPRDFYEELNKEFNFDFDPCPLAHDMSWDGLEIDWGQRSFVNPPYTKKLLGRFVRKAHQESLKGKVAVCLIPASTDTALFHDVILPSATEIRWVRGRLKFKGKNNQGKTKNWSEMKGSMIVVFGAWPQE